MKILVLSDIHANNFALDEVIKDAKKHYAGYEAVWFLGDLIGHGAHPVESYSAVKQVSNHDGQHHVWLGGNHEATLKKIAKGQIHLSNTEQVDMRHLEELFSTHTDAKEHFENITKEENKRQDLSIGDWKFYFTHASYHDPDDEYLYSWFEHSHIIDMFKKEFLALPGHGMESRCMLYGHTHVPTLVEIKQNLDGSLGLEAKKIVPFKPYTLKKNSTWIINPGSVGLPRDLDPRASYAIMEIHEDSAGNSEKNKVEDTITFCRVEYGVDEAIDAMEKMKYDFISSRQEYSKHLYEAMPVSDTPPSWVEHYKLASQIQRKDRGD